jgi:hypothetical protein
VQDFGPGAKNYNSSANAHKYVYKSFGTFAYSSHSFRFLEFLNGFLLEKEVTY